MDLSSRESYCRYNIGRRVQRKVKYERSELKKDRLRLSTASDVRGGKPLALKIDD